jgi:hypothetical protein
LSQAIERLAGPLASRVKRALVIAIQVIDI